MSDLYNVLLSKMDEFNLLEVGLLCANIPANRGILCSSIL